MKIKYCPRCEGELKNYFGNYSTICEFCVGKIIKYLISSKEKIYTDLFVDCYYTFSEDFICKYDGTLKTCEQFFREILVEKEILEFKREYERNFRGNLQKF
ncbi:MAG: hypothetical protein AABY22_36750 [Nanoarchaeota archaeon]